MQAPVTNHGTHVIYVRGKSIPPGETRMCEVAAVAPPVHSDDLSNAEIIEKMLTHSAPQLSRDILPTLDADILQELIAAETAGKNRKTVIEAAHECLLQLSASVIAADQFAVTVKSASDAELAEMLASGDYTHQPAFEAIIRNEQDARA